MNMIKKFKKTNHGINNGKWKGGRIRTGEGYILIYCPSHPNSTKRGYVLEHRLIAEKKIGRYLLPNEDVHHINYDKKDNRQENLIVISHSNHQKIEGKRNLGKYKRKDVLNDKIKEYLSLNYSVRKIGRIFNISHNSIRNRIKHL